MIADDCEDYSCKQGQADNKFNYWSDSESNWWVIKYEKTNVIAVLKLLIVRYTAEKKDIFYIYSLIVNLNVKFVHKIYFNYKFDEFKNH